VGNRHAVVADIDDVADDAKKKKMPREMIAIVTDVPVG